MLVLQISGMSGVSAEGAVQAKADLAFVQDILVELTEVWPTVTVTADSLRKLALEYAILPDPAQPPNLSHAI